MKKILFLLPVMLFLAWQPLSAQEEKPPAKEAPAQEEPKEVTITEKDDYVEIAIADDGQGGMSLGSFVRLASDKTGKTFLISATARNRLKTDQIVLTRSVRVPKVDFFSWAQSILRAHNIAVMPIGPRSSEVTLVEDMNSQQGRLLKTSAKFVPIDELEFYADQALLISTTIPVNYMDINKAQTQLRNLVNTQVGGLYPVSGVNAIIVTEYGPTVWAVYHLIKAMDQQPATQQILIEKVRLKYASPEEIEGILAELIRVDRGGSSRSPSSRSTSMRLGTQEKPEPKIISDPRTGSLIISAIKEDMENIKALIAQLDEEVKEIESNYNIYYLKHTNAEEMQETLTDVIEGTLQRRQGAGRRPGRTGTVVQPTSGSEEEVKVIADVPTNSLIVAASKTKFLIIKQLIEELDKRRPQVFVEAAILELLESDSLDLAVELGFVGFSNDILKDLQDGEGLPFGFSNFGLSTVTIDPASGSFSRTPAEGLLRGGGLLGGIFNGDAFQIPLVINAIAGASKSNLLSMPSILTNDNSEATIEASTSEPTSQTNLSGSGLSSQGFQYVEAVKTLTVSPHISPDNYLRLDIKLVIESFTEEAPGLGVPPAKASRMLEGSVTLPDGACMVVGGITVDDERYAESKIPILGDIPILGALFKSSSTTKIRNTVWLFLRPHILEEFAQLDEISHQKKTEIKRLEGQIDMVDPNFREIKISDDTIPIEELESSQRLDMPLYRSPSDRIAGGEKIDEDTEEFQEDEGILEEVENEGAGESEEDVPQDKEE